MIRPLILTALTISAPAEARTLSDRIDTLPIEQKAAIGVAVIDTIATWRVLDHGGREVGPMSIPFGPHPSKVEVAGTRIGTMLISSAIVSLVQDENPTAARWLARVNLAFSATGAAISVRAAFR